MIQGLQHALQLAMLEYACDKLKGLVRPMGNQKVPVSAAYVI